MKKRDVRDYYKRKTVTSEECARIVHFAKSFMSERRLLNIKEFNNKRECLLKALSAEPEVSRIAACAIDTSGIVSNIVINKKKSPSNE
jgi:hypothetical protein